MRIRKNRIQRQPPHWFNMSNALNREEEAAAQRFDRWKKSGVPRQWVLEHLEGWDHATWVTMINSVKATPYWPLHVLQVMTVLEEMRHELRNQGLGDAANEQAPEISTTEPNHAGRNFPRRWLHRIFSNADFMIAVSADFAAPHSSESPIGPLAGPRWGPFPSIGPHRCIAARHLTSGAAAERSPTPAG